MILSGKKAAFFDPQMKIWQDKHKQMKSAHRVNLQNVREKWPDTLMPLDGIADFEVSSDKAYEHTLFRFPLRTNKDSLLLSTKKVIEVSEVRKLMNSLREEVEVLLLFLRSVESIKVYSIDEHGKHSLEFAAEIAEKDRHSLRKERQSFKANLAKFVNCNQSYGISTPISFTAKFKVEVTNCDREGDTWLVSNRAGLEGYNADIATAADELCTFPWVGTALNLTSTIDVGRIFCVVPLPAEATTSLPVHVNGTFSMNDDRRSLKWPGKEQMNDARSNWTKLLVDKVVPPCYATLLKEALKHLEAERFYAAIPDVGKISKHDPKWEGLLKPLCSEVFKTACLSSLSRIVRPNQATFIPDKDQVIGDTVEEVLEACGHDVVRIPSTIWQALRLGVGSRFPSLKKVTPDLVKRSMRDCERSYNRKSKEEKLDLLRYCLTVESKDDSDDYDDDNLECDFSDLHGLHLLPLASDEFTSFEPSTSAPCYVCSVGFAHNLLPNAEKYLVDPLPDDISLRDLLKMVAQSGSTQLKMLDAQGVANLLVHVFPQEWEEKVEVRLDTSCLPRQWFQTFWNWVKHHRLSLFKDKLVVPIAHNSHDPLTIMKLSSPIVRVKKGEEVSRDMEAVLSKLDIKYTLRECVPWLDHEDLLAYLQPLTPRGVLKAISKDHEPIRKICFSKVEANAFQNFLISASSSSQSCLNREILKNLSIFFPSSSLTPVSLKECQSKMLLMEPFDSHILEEVCEYLPPSIVVFSRNDNQESLLEMSALVEFPESIASLLGKYVFPLIKDGSFSGPSMELLMQKVIFGLSFLEGKRTSITQEISDLEFIPVGFSMSKKRPSQLYDPSDGGLKALFQGKPVFPLEPFDQDQYLQSLRKCHLKVSVDGQGLYDILLEIAAGGSSLSYVGEVNASRARAVFKYIRDTPKVLKHCVCVNMSKFCLLKDAICRLAEDKCVFPVEVCPPDDYPECLPWKGFSHTNYLTVMNDTVLPCTTEKKKMLSHIVGSQMYIFACHADLLSGLHHLFPAEGVVGHLMEVVQCKDNFQSGELDVIISKLYQFMQDNSKSLASASKQCAALRDNKWVWLPQEGKFVQPTDIAFEEHPSFHDSLSPYLYITPSISNKTLFTSFGAHEKVTNELVVSLLKRLNPDISWNMLMSILNWITDGGKKYAHEITDPCNVYVPVKSRSNCTDPCNIYVPVKSCIQLVRVQDVTYIENKSMRHVLLPRALRQNLNVIHEKCEHIAKYLGATTVSKKLDIVEDLCTDASQSEPLVKRLGNILRDYRGGLTIVKELLQNADDAGATEVNICYDARDHLVGEEKLLFPGMARAHGPALVFHNNETFTAKDFEDIQNLAGATKRDQPLKIGKFGVGFCSVYHITDVPSFVSGDRLFIFDPELKCLEDVVTNPAMPGKQLLFAKETELSSAQMSPYDGLFGFKDNCPYNGTIFRLPFRSKESTISGIKYNETEVERLRDDVKREGSKLLLFLENVNSITFSKIASGQEAPKQLLQITKHIQSTHCDSTPCSRDSTPCDPTTCDSTPSVVLIEDVQCMYYPVEICEDLDQSRPQSSGTESISQDVSKVQVYISDFQCEPCTSEEHWLIAKCRDIDNQQVSAVACSLEQLAFDRYSPRPIAGEVFCFLPLRLVSGLEVHVSANFAVTNDRTGIQVTSKSEESEFNVMLMKKSIPLAYHKLLTTLRDLYQENRVDSYTFHSLWPAKDNLEAHNPWDDFITEIYKLISNSALCYSETVKEWKYLQDCVLLPRDILQSAHRKDVVEAMAIMQYCLIQPPLLFTSHFDESDVSKCTISEMKFLEDFFTNIDRFPVQTRNNILLSLIMTYAKQESSNLESSPAPETLQQFIEEKSCIPCSPEGEMLRRCCEVVDHRDNRLGRLYESSDGRFVTAEFQGSIVLGALQELGMLSSKLPNWDMVMERAGTISELYKSDKDKALERVELLLHCFPHPDLPPPDLSDIAFLPILQKPHDYPRELIWKGTGHHLLSNSGLLVGSERNISLAGSVVSMISTASTTEGGCGEISPLLESTLKTHLSPSVSDVMKQLAHIASIETEHLEKNTPWINSACKTIYSFIDQHLQDPEEHAERLNCEPLPEVLVRESSSCEPLPEVRESSSCEPLPEVRESSSCEPLPEVRESSSCEPLPGVRESSSCEPLRGVRENFTCESLPGLLWTGRKFIHPSSIAVEWRHDGPFLYQVPPLLSGLHNLLKLLDLKKTFETDQILKALVDLKHQYGDQKLPDIEETAVISIVQALADSIKNNDIHVTDHTHKPCYLPDESLRMRKVEDLSWNDAPWCKLDQEVYFIHSKVPLATAQKVGVKPLQLKALEEYSAAKDYFSGVDFGQHEELILRIRSILDTYTHNETILKELLQNADDAKATKLYFILDKRSHGTERVPSENWKDLQGPAFLVWNDKGFSEEDFRGIQRLGLGSKRSKADSIGQFGIGFNAVYRLTDCPSFFTNGDTLCVFDPQFCYVPGASEVKPGKRWNGIGEKFWGNWSDLKSTYLQDGLNCLDEISSEGTLFRLPLRSSAESKLIDSNISPYTSSTIEGNLNEWAPKMKEALLFLKHVTELRFFVIEENATVMTTTHHYKVTLSKDDVKKLKTLQETCKNFTTENSKEGIVVNYHLELAEKLPNQLKEEWLVQQGVGDIQNPSQHWQFLDRIKPVHGIAAKIKGGEFEPKVFCFLPLSLKSKLPVHVNGNFILESSRSCLWQSRDSEADDKKRWNDRLIEALGSSYANFLEKCQSIVVDKSFIAQYYAFFPRWIDLPYDQAPEGDMLQLARCTYEILGRLKSKVLIVVKEVEPSILAISHINWQPVLNDVSSEQVYFGPQMDSVQSVEYDESPSDVHCVQSVEYDESPSDVDCVQSVEYVDCVQSVESPSDVDWMQSVEYDESPSDVYCPNSEVLATIMIDSVYDQQATSPPSVEQLPSPIETDSERFPEVLPILRRLGILFTAAPPWIQQHFSSLEVDIPQASPDAVFEYFSKNSCQANRVSGKFPCKLQDTAFEDDGSFKTFVQYITKKEIVEDDENPYSCTVFISSPFNLPLLLTADGFLRVFTDNQKVIASSHCGIFSSESERFLHPKLLELKLDPKYFLEPSPNNLELISVVLDSTLDRSLCCARLKSASSFIPTKVLKRLWSCLTKDPLFKKHTKDIVQRWALILSDKDELFMYDPKHTSLMPVAAPCKPKRSPNETPPSQEDEQEYRFHLKLYDIFRANGMPTLNFKVKHYCPSFQNPESILINLYHLYTQQGGGSDVPTTVADTMLMHNNIPEIFTYFSQINFAKDKGQGRLRNLLRSLPLFMSKDGRYHCLQGNVYLWPEYICLDGLAELLSETSAVFLPEDGMWTKFSADTIGATLIYPMKLYVDYLFPHFHLLSKGDRLRQLEHIRDTEELFEAAHVKCKMKRFSSEPAESIEKEFLEGLGRLPIIMNNGELACIGKFCDPRNSVFKHFPNKYNILPDAFNDDKWLSFFEEIGLKMKPTLGEYEEFCHHVSSGNHGDVIKASQALLDCLFKTHDWHKEESFLHEIREISFVCVDALDQYSGIHPASTANVKVVPQQDGTSVKLTCLKKCINYKHASLTWTIRPVVHLPAEITVPPINIFLNSSARIQYEKVFMEHLGVLMKPSPSDVLENIRNISQSCFSNFKLFDCYSDEYITKNADPSGLVDIVEKNLSYLSEILTKKSTSQQNEVDLMELSSLQFIPCIPVCSDCTGDVSRPVLVKPFQAVCNLQEDLRSPLHPFLCRIPEEIGYLKVFDHIGVNLQPQLSNVLHALELINTHAETPFNHNTTTSVTILLKLLYEHLSFKSSIAFKGDEILYLPSEDGNSLRALISFIMTWIKLCTEMENSIFLLYLTANMQWPPISAINMMKYRSMVFDSLT